MKEKLLWVAMMALLLVHCKREETPIHNLFTDFHDNEPQLFELGTAKTAEIRGKQGTVYYFNREDFDVSENQNISVRLEEYYEFEALFFQNLRTVTSSGKLLESSGVFRIQVFNEGQELFPKKDRRLHVGFPKDKIKDNDLFTGVLDSVRQIEWDVLAQDSVIVNENFYEVHVGGGIRVTGLTSDTIGYVAKDYSRQLAQDSEYGIPKSDNISKDKMPAVQKKIVMTKDIEPEESIDIALTKMSYVNIDRFVDTDFSDWDVVLKDKEDYGWVTVYFMYEDRNAFWSEFRVVDDLNFRAVPYIENATKILVVAKKRQQLYWATKVLGEERRVAIKLKASTNKKFRKLIRSLSPK